MASLPCYEVPPLPPYLHIRYVTMTELDEWKRKHDKVKDMWHFWIHYTLKTHEAIVVHGDWSRPRAFTWTPEHHVRLLDEPPLPPIKDDDTHMVTHQRAVTVEGGRGGSGTNAVVAAPPLTNLTSAALAEAARRRVSPVSQTRSSAHLLIRPIARGSGCARGRGRLFQDSIRQHHAKVRRMQALAHAPKNT